MCKGIRLALWIRHCETRRTSVPRRSGAGGIDLEAYRHGQEYAVCVRYGRSGILGLVIERASLELSASESEVQSHTGCAPTNRLSEAFLLPRR